MKIKSTQPLLKPANAQSNRIALFNAIKSTGEDVTGVIEAVKAGANLNEPNEDILPLECAIIHNKFERFKILATLQPVIGDPANLNATVLIGASRAETSLLHCAAKFGRASIVKYLLSQGLSDTAQDEHKRGLLPIHYAARSNDRTTLDALNYQQQALKAVSAIGDSPLHIAAELGKINMVHYLLELGADVNCRDNEDRTPLHRAAQTGQNEVISLLLSYKSSRNQCDKNGRNPFLYAVATGNIDVVSLLILQDDKYSFADSEGVTAMHIAAEKNKLPMMLFLNGKDSLTFSVKDKNLKRPIHFAAHDNAIDVFDTIIKAVRSALLKAYGAKLKGAQLEEEVSNELVRRLLSWQDSTGDTIIEYAVRGNAVGIIDRLIQLGLRLDRSNRERGPLMHEAAKLGKAGIVGLLLQYGVNCTDKNAEGKTPLLIAVEHGQISVLEELLKSGKIDFKYTDADGAMLIHLASAAGQGEVVDWLDENKTYKLSDVDKEGRNCLFYAVRSDQDELIMHLVKNKKMPSTTVCNKGLTVMHHAVFKKAKKAIAKLIQLGLSLTTPGKGGMLPFHVACKSGSTDMVDFLIDAGVDGKACNNLGRNGWYYAVVQQNTQMLTCLDKHHIPLLDIRDNQNFTPMHIAAMGGNLEAIKYFYNRGLNPFATNKLGVTPLAKARTQCKIIESEMTENLAKTDPKKYANVQSRLADCRAVELYLINLPNDLKELPVAKIEVIPEKEKSQSKREREALPTAEKRIIKPKLVDAAHPDVDDAEQSPAKPDFNQG